MIPDQIQQALSQLKKTIPENDFKSQKKLEILEFIVEGANDLLVDAKMLSDYQKKIPRIARKRPYSRKEANKLKFLLGFKQLMRGIHLQVLVSQPIHVKWDKGAAARVV